MNHFWLNGNQRDREMLRSVRVFSTSSLLLKKRTPFKRLVTPVGEYSPQDKAKMKEQARTAFYQKISDRAGNSAGKSAKTGKGKQGPLREPLPVLEEFTTEQLKQNEGIVSKITSFDELKLEPAVREAVVKSIQDQTVLRAQNFETHSIGEQAEELEVKPSPIQAITIHHLAKHLMEPNMKIYTMAAETGSGKTWAYLAPLVDFLKQQELQPDWDSKKDKALVRSVILVPTHELAQQVYESLQVVQESLGLHCVKWDTGMKHHEFLNRFKERIDILITTPGKIVSMENIRIISKPEHILQATKFVVVDEADTLMDRSFVEMTYGAMKKMPNVSRMVLCSATISTQYHAALEKIFPGSQRELLISPKMHKTPKSIKFKVIDSDIAPYQGSKNKALAQIMYAIYKDGTEQSYEKRCVVFVNNKIDVAKVAQKLQGSGHEVVALTGDDTPIERSEKIRDFVTPPKLLADLAVKEESTPVYETIPGSNIQLNKSKDVQEDHKRMKVLVTSDVASRGLNFFGVRNVILYDSPNTPVDMLHRIGRTGRMGQSGRVFLISDSKTRHWVKQFMKRRGASM